MTCREGGAAASHARFSFCAASTSPSVVLCRRPRAARSLSDCSLGPCLVLPLMGAGNFGVGRAAAGSGLPDGLPRLGSSGPEVAPGVPSTSRVSVPAKDVACFWSATCCLPAASLASCSCSLSANQSGACLTGSSASAASISARGLCTGLGSSIDGGR